MSLFTRLTRLIARRDETPAAPQDAERLAVAALLVHVARIDGTLSPPERARLLAILAERFGRDAEDLLDEAGEADYRAGDLEALIDMLGHDADAAERERLLALAVEVAGSDGTLHEFEDGVLWRLARALRLDEGALARAQGAAHRAP
jgi:uncharacterized tellurite resistance protein B-like protein